MSLQSETQDQGGSPSTEQEGKICMQLLIDMPHMQAGHGRAAEGNCGTGQEVPGRPY